MGYTSQQFLVCDNSSNANLRTWGSAISAAIAAMGWTKTADTGQVDWSTVVTGSGYVYEIWQPADALQTGATAFYLKLEYDTNSGAVGIRISVGTSTNGSGTLTGFVTNLLTSSTIANQGSAGYECDFSGDTDRLGMILWRNLISASAILLAIERTKNTDGSNNGDGVTIVYQSISTGGQQTLVFGVGAAQQTATRSFCALSNNVNASDAFNNNIPISPIFPDYGKYGNPMTTICMLHTQDIAEGGTFSTNLYGAVRTYLATANTGAMSPTSMKLAIRYD